jgi:hypothetical protein
VGAIIPSDSLAGTLVLRADLPLAVYSAVFPDVDTDAMPIGLDGKSRLLPQPGDVPRWSSVHRRGIVLTLYTELGAQ